MEKIKTKFPQAIAIGMGYKNPRTNAQGKMIGTPYFYPIFTKENAQIVEASGTAVAHITK